MAANSPYPTHINRNGGIDCLITHLGEIGLWKSLDEVVGKRHRRAEYSYSDVIQTWTLNEIAGSRRLEHSYNNRASMKAHPKFQKGMSPDTISRVVRSLAVENDYYSMSTYKRGQKAGENRLIIVPTDDEKQESNEVNLNLKLNTFLLDTAIDLRLLEPGEEYALDIDATTINTKVSDSRWHFKQATGYCPMVVIFGGIPIFLEARNGNSNAIFRKYEVLKMAIELIESRGLKIKFVRIDAAGSNKRILRYLMRRETPFFIRAHGRYKEQLKKSGTWRSLRSQKHLRGSDNVFWLDDQELRIVEYQAKGKIDDIEDPKVWAIFTNDISLTIDEVITTYNQRGAMENRFADLKEMGWKYMVHRELKYNTVHMLITMLAYILFIYAKRWLASKLPFIKETIKPKTFITQFIQVLTVWAGNKMKFMDRQKDFEPLEAFP